MFEKFGQHQPLNRQAERYAKEGVDLSLSTLADQVIVKRLQSSPGVANIAVNGSVVRQVQLFLKPAQMQSYGVGVDRIVAAPDTEAFGRLSVMLQYRFECAHVFDVPPGAFRPMPKVMSAIVQLRPRPVEQLAARDPQLMSDIVKAAFGQRRKTLRNALQLTCSGADIEAAGLRPDARAEQLAVSEFVQLAAHLGSLPPAGATA